MAKRPLPSPELLRQLLDYYPETGILIWKERGAEHFKGPGRDSGWRARNWNAKNAGREAFQSNLQGYKIGGLCGETWRAHRVIWAWMTGEWPDEDIDHINGLRSDNRWCNLRSVSRVLNGRNQKLRSNNKSGVNGVRWRKDCQKWRAEICLNGRNVYLGYFTDKEDAIKARAEAEKENGFTKDHGRRLA